MIFSLQKQVIFTQQGQVAGSSVLGGLTQGTTYYIKQILSNTEFTIGLTRNATSEVSLTNDTGVMNVTQWEQTNIERLWVTVNGYRLPTDKLRVDEARWWFNQAKKECYFKTDRGITYEEETTA